MKFKRINDNRLQIIVSSKDLLARNIKRCDLVPYNLTAQALLKEILEKAIQDCDFQVMQDTSILVEVYPIEGDSLLLMLTKVDDINFRLSSLTNHEISTLLNENTRENEEKFNDKIGVYFEELDDVYDYFEHKNTIIEDGKLYYDNSIGKYILILIKDDMDRFLNLTEYGRQEYISSSYLLEHCTLLASGNIMNVLNNTLNCMVL